MSAASSPRTWEQNADDFASLDRGEGWVFARLVACSVERGASNGRPSETRSADRVSPKVSASNFSERAGTTRPTRTRRVSDQGQQPERRVLAHRSSRSQSASDS